jgi:two-component system, NarL family, sensor histidine kinase ComP
MPDVVELALFRVLQEGLINAHRHSGSNRVEVSIENCASGVRLRLKDFGKGLGTDLLERFQRTGAGAGVGLAGMRERVKELGGEFSVQSDHTGTVLGVAIPVADNFKAGIST